MWGKVIKQLANDFRSFLLPASSPPHKVEPSWPPLQSLVPHFWARSPPSPPRRLLSSNKWSLTSPKSDTDLFPRSSKLLPLSKRSNPSFTPRQLWPTPPLQLWATPPPSPRWERLLLVRTWPMLPHQPSTLTTGMDSQPRLTPRGKKIVTKIHN